MTVHTAYRQESMERHYRDRANTALRRARLMRLKSDRAEAARWLAHAADWRRRYVTERLKPYDPQLLRIRAATAAYRARQAGGFTAPPD